MRWSESSSGRAEDEADIEEDDEDQANISVSDDNNSLGHKTQHQTDLKFSFAANVAAQSAHLRQSLEEISPTVRVVVSDNTDCTEVAAFETENNYNDLVEAKGGVVLSQERNTPKRFERPFSNDDKVEISLSSEEETKPEINMINNVDMMQYDEKQSSSCVDSIV